MALGFLKRLFGKSIEEEKANDPRTVLNLIKGLKKERWLYEEFKRWCGEHQMKLGDCIIFAVYNFLKNQDNWELKEPDCSEEMIQKKASEMAEAMAWQLAPQLAQQYIQNMFNFTKSFAELMSSFKSELSTLEIETQIKKLRELAKELGIITNNQQVNSSQPKSKEENIDELKLLMQIIQARLSEMKSKGPKIREVNKGSNKQTAQKEEE